MKRKDILLFSFDDLNHYSSFFNFEFKRLLIGAESIPAVALCPAKGGVQLAAKNATPMSVLEPQTGSDQLASRPTPTIAKLRDQAIIGVLRYANAPVDAIIALRVEDYYPIGNRRWFRTVQNGIERHELIDVKLEHLIDKYLLASGIENELHTPLFRATLSGSGKVSSRPVHRFYVAKLARQITNLRSVHLTLDNAEHLLDKIRPTSRENIRDRAIIGMMLHVSATPREIAAFRTSDYLDNGDWCCIKLARSRIVEVPKALHVLLRDYVRVENPPQDTLLFRVDRSRGMTAANIEKMIRRWLNEIHAPRRRFALHGFTDSN